MSGVSAEEEPTSGDLDGPLRHVVEQLWQPAIDTGEVRVRLGDPAPGWQEVESYLVLPTPSHATMLLPTGPRPALTGALLNYRGLRRRLPSAQRSVLGAVVRSGAPLPFARLSVQTRQRPAGATAPLLPLAMLAADLGLPEVFASIGVRTGANRKATLQLVEATGRPAGFAKLAWDDASALGVHREGLALSSPVTSGPARTPTLLGQGDFYGWPYILTSPLPGDSRGVRADVPAPSAQEMFALCPIERTARIGATGQFLDLRNRVAGLTDDPGLRLLQASLRQLLDRLDECPIEVPVSTRWHGDLTPWNSARDKEGILWVWDWESSEPDAVAGIDAYHWHLTVRTEAGHQFDGAALLAAHQGALPTLVAAGVPVGARGHVAGLYVASLVERACWLAAGAGGWEAGWVLPTQLLDLTGTALQLMEQP